ncbi:unnamed protein product, partial [Nezara viridula]
MNPSSQLQSQLLVSQPAPASARPTDRCRRADYSNRPALSPPNYIQSVCSCATISNAPILSGNTNTYLPVVQDLELPFVASRVRFIPYSEHPRTVCMRVEIYGCPWEESMISYTTSRGDSGLEDDSYDGILDGGLMKGGLGQLVDGLYGPNDFILETRDNPDSRDGQGMRSKYCTSHCIL